MKTNPALGINVVSFGLHKRSWNGHKEHLDLVFTQGIVPCEDWSHGIR